MILTGSERLSGSLPAPAASTQQGHSVLVRMLYISEIASGLEESDIARLVAAARRRNRQLDLTGALLVCDGHFAQALEGQEAAVTEMMGKIAVDERHCNLRLRENETIAQRMFVGWDMAFADESRCLEAVDDLLAGRVAPQQFLQGLLRIVEEQREAPY